MKVIHTLLFVAFVAVACGLGILGFLYPSVWQIADGLFLVGGVAGALLVWWARRAGIESTRPAPPPLQPDARRRLRWDCALVFLTVAPFVAVSTWALIAAGDHLMETGERMWALIVAAVGAPFVGLAVATPRLFRIAGTLLAGIVDPEASG